VGRGWDLTILMGTREGLLHLPEQWHIYEGTYYHQNLFRHNPIWNV